MPPLFSRTLHPLLKWSGLPYSLLFLSGISVYASVAVQADDECDCPEFPCWKAWSDNSQLLIYNLPIYSRRRYGQWAVWWRGGRFWHSVSDDDIIRTRLFPASWRHLPLYPLLFRWRWFLPLLHWKLPTPDIPVIVAGTWIGGILRCLLPEELSCDYLMILLPCFLSLLLAINVHLSDGLGDKCGIHFPYIFCCPLQWIRDADWHTLWRCATRYRFLLWLVCFRLRRSDNNDRKYEKELQTLFLFLYLQFECIYTVFHLGLWYPQKL